MTDVVVRADPKSICVKCRWCVPPFVQTHSGLTGGRRDFEFTCIQPNLQPTKLPDGINVVTGELVTHIVFSPMCKDVNDGFCRHYEQRIEQ